MALSLLISLIVFFFGDRILLIPILTLLFLFYVLTITPPPEVEHIVTTFGIETTGITLRWEFLSHFYYTKNLVLISLQSSVTPLIFTTRIWSYPTTKLKKGYFSFSKHLMYMEKAPRNFTDKVIEFLSKLIPDDEEVVQKQMPASL